MDHLGRALIISISLWIPATPSLSQELLREGPILLVAPGASKALEEGPAPERPDDVQAIARSIGARLLPEEALLEEGGHVVLLTGASTGTLSRFGEAQVEALAAAVREKGIRLVVVGDAAAALPDSKAFSALLGRKSPPPASGTAPPGQGLPLAVIDQEHPITQCLTHWVLRGGCPTAEGDPSTTALIVKGPARPPGGGAGPPPTGPRPVLWLRREGAGRVVVLAVEPSPMRDGREDGLLSALIARSVEFTAGRDIRVRLPDQLPLLAPALDGRGTEDLLGLPPLEGFYRGRQIAPVMGYGGASWLVRPDREETEEPEKVLDSLKIREGSTIADLGAGVGYFTFRMAHRVGPRGKVLAVDVQPEMVQAVKARAKEEGAGNVEAILSTEKDPGLPAASVDLVLMVDVYHELADPVPVMGAVRRALAKAGGGAPPGRLVLVEYRGEDPRVPIKPLHRTTREQVLAELVALGFRWLETQEFLRHQRVIVFAAGEDR